MDENAPLKLYVVSVLLIIVAGLLAMQSHGGADQAVETAVRLSPSIATHVQNVAGVGSVLWWNDPEHAGVVCYARGNGQGAVGCVLMGVK